MFSFHTEASQNKLLTFEDKTVPHESHGKLWCSILTLAIILLNNEIYTSVMIQIILNFFLQ